MEHSLHGKALCRGFQSPSKFYEHSCKDELKNEVKLIILDYMYKAPHYNVMECNVLEELRNNLEYKGKIVLFSNLSDFGENNQIIKEKFDAVLSKKDFDRDLFIPYLS